MLRRKIQVLRAVNHDADRTVGTPGLPPWVVRELLDTVQAAANYFGYPYKAKPGVHREGRDKFNALIDKLDQFDFGTFAPDELRGDDLDERA